MGFKTQLNEGLSIEEFEPGAWAIVVNGGSDIVHVVLWENEVRGKLFGPQGNTIGETRHILITEDTTLTIGRLLDILAEAGYAEYDAVDIVDTVKTYLAIEEERATCRST